MRPMLESLKKELKENNKMKKWLVAFLMMAAGACFAADMYVDPDVAAPGGGTEGNPYKLVDNGWKYVGDGETVYLMAGTYDTSTQGATWVLDIDLAKSVTFEPYVADTEIDFTFGASAAGIELTANLNNETITFKSINFDFSTTNYYGLYQSGAAAAGNIVFDNCDMVQNNAAFYGGLYIAQNLGSITIQNGSNMSVQRTANNNTKGEFLDLRAALLKLVVKDSQCHCLTSVAGATNAHNNYVFNLSEVAGASVGEVVFINSQFSSANANVFNIGEATGITGHFYAEGCTFTELTENVTSAYPIIGMGVGFNSTANWATTTAYTLGDVVDNDGVIYTCTQDHTSGDADDEPGDSDGVWVQWWRFNTDACKVHVENCTITSSSTGRGYGILLGATVQGALLKNNIVYNNLWQIVVKGGNNVIIGNVTSGSYGISTFSLDRNFILNNTVYVNSGFGIGFGSEGGSKFGQDTIVSGNIVYGAAGSTKLITDNSGDGAPGADNGCYVNWNSVYSVNATNWFSLQGNTYNTLALFQTQWGVQSDAFGSINSQDSINTDPQLVDPAASPPDVRLPAGSPCLNAGQATPNNGYTSFGAWQQKQGTRRRRWW